ncbi:hypothetical protein SteCoe_20533 [Stentor coeruleus]|uniref:Peptidase M14 domain-containing protein n=1 Tax=Stentor coeruleus TaxID=5963 RepID=A0A1R2BRH7_9CILI|nr:hypothetical protein SteCoe_20533 [Stentor coeruleus]
MNFNQHFDLNFANDQSLYLPSQVYTNARYKFELGGLLVYDVKAELKKGDFIIPPNSPFNLKRILTTSQYTLDIPDDPSLLTFNSKFECGNLSKAIKLSDYEYDLYIRSDTNNPRQNHWYYFSVYNPRKTAITFNICNLKKPDPLYQSGMKPCTWSCYSKHNENQEWHRSGTCISYFLKENNSYTLKFTYNFKNPNDTVYFAYSQPYSYTDCQTFLKTISSSNKDICRLNTLCLTNDGKECNLLTITDSIQDYIDYDNEVKDMNDMVKYLRKFKKPKSGLKRKTSEKHVNKKAIVLMARVHSGETVSSFMMKGAIEYLLSSLTSAVFLRKNFVFKIVPMLNPDGVYHGNYRCCLKGLDLNRMWLRPHKNISPTIYYSKLMIFAIAARHDIKLVCDFHGHTKKKSVFMYGCSVKPDSYEDSRNNLLTRVVPYYMYKRNNFFSFRLSHYRIEKYKESTSRIVFFKELQIPHSYTMEASFFGPEGGNSHFSAGDLESLGRDLCRFCTVFIKNGFYLRVIADTNNYLRNLRIKSLLQKYQDKNCKSPMEIPSAPVPDKQIEISLLKDSETTQPETYDTLFASDEELEQIEEQEEKEEQDEKIDENTFWEQVDIVPCLPDAESSGSDSELFDDIKEDIEKTENIPIKPPITTTVSVVSSIELEKKIKIVKHDRFLNNRNSSVPKNSQNLQLSTNKKINESLAMQTFRFPDTDIEIKRSKLFEPLKASIGIRASKHRNSKSPNTGKNSLSFLPALNSFSKSGGSKKMPILMSFQGISEQISKIVTFRSQFHQRK